MMELLGLKDKYKISNEDFTILMQGINRASTRNAECDGAIINEASKRDINYCDLSHECLPYDFDRVQTFAWWFINQFKTKDNE